MSSRRFCCVSIPPCLLRIKCKHNGSVWTRAVKVQHAYTRNDCVICWPPKKKPNNQYPDRVHYGFVQTQTRHAKYIHGSNRVFILVAFLLSCFRFQCDPRFCHARHALSSNWNFLLRRFWNSWFYFILHFPVWTSSHGLKGFLEFSFQKLSCLFSSFF